MPTMLLDETKCLSHSYVGNQAGLMLLKTFYINSQERIHWMRMDRNEAVAYLKEHLRNCNDMSPEALSFEKPPQYHGYTVRIKGTITEADKKVAKEIAIKHSLEVKEEKGEVIIYRPT